MISLVRCFFLCPLGESGISYSGSGSEQADFFTSTSTSVGVFLQPAAAAAHEPTGCGTFAEDAFSFEAFPVVRDPTNKDYSPIRWP